MRSQLYSFLILVKHQRLHQSASPCFEDKTRCDNRNTSLGHGLNSANSEARNYHWSSYHATLSPSDHEFLQMEAKILLWNFFPLLENIDTLIFIMIPQARRSILYSPWWWKCSVSNFGLFANWAMPEIKTDYKSSWHLEKQLKTHMTPKWLISFKASRCFNNTIFNFLTVGFNETCRSRSALILEASASLAASVRIEHSFAGFFEK